MRWQVLDWATLARERQTLALYMGVAGLGTIRDELVRHGRAASTPVAIVENGSRSNQRVVLATLAELEEAGRIAAVQSPALVIVGEVAALATEPALVRVEAHFLARTASRGLTTTRGGGHSACQLTSANTERGRPGK